MTAAKHTMGPWQRSGVRVKLGAEDCLQVGPDGFPVAFLPIGKSATDHAGAIADAALIAAAPELLDALLECLECEFHVTEKAAIDKARAAIAKATGEAA